MENNNQWLSFLWSLHNKVRNAKGIKLTGISALNEISNFLLFFFMEKKIVKHKLPEYCKFSYLYEKYASKQAYAEDRKQPELVKKNMYLLWHTVYDINNNDDCVIKCLLKNEFFKKYLHCMTHKPSSYALNNKAMQTIQECFTSIYEKLKDVEWSHEKFDMFGSAFEQFKEDAADKKTLGQHFTPPSIKNYIMEEMRPNYEDLFYDPCSGSGGFVHTATSYVYKHDTEENYNKFKKHIYANECDPELTKTLMINMLLHDVPVTNIHEMDSLDYNENCKEYLHKFDKIATNPPFGMKITHDYVDVKHFTDYWKPLIASKKIIKDSTAQFILHIMNSLKQEEGQAGIVIDRGFLNNGCDNVNSWETTFRKYILENYNLYKVVLLPVGIFTYTNFATAIIFIKTGAKTKQVDFYVGKFKDPNNKKSELITETEPDKIVKIKEIIKNNWSLKYELDKPKEEVNDNDKQEGDLWVKLSTVCKLENGTRITKTSDGSNVATSKYKYPVYGGGGITFYTDSLNRQDKTIVISRFGVSLNCVRLIEGDFFLNDSGMSIISSDNNKLNNLYLFYCLKINQHNVFNLVEGQGQKNMNITRLNNYKIPLLPLPHQQEITEFLDNKFEEHELKIDNFVKQIGKTNVFKLLINKQYDDFEELIFLVKQKITYNRLLKDMEKEKKIKFKQELGKVKTEKKRLGDLVDCKKGKRTLKDNEEKSSYNLYSSSIHNIYKSKFNDFEKGIIINSTNGQGKCYITVDENFSCTTDTLVLIPNEKSQLYFIHKYLLSLKNKIELLFTNNDRKHLYWNDLKELEINLPSLSDQEKIVKEIEKVNDKQHHFQQHTETIEKALEYALETVKNTCVEQDNNEDQDQEIMEQDNVNSGDDIESNKSSVEEEM